MVAYFTNGDAAMRHCINTKSFALFYSADTDPNSNMHVHDCCEVHYIISGGQYFFINDKVYDVQPYDVFIVNQYETHKITNKEDDVFERFVFSVHPSWLISNSSVQTELSLCFYARDAKTSHRISLSDEQRDYLTHSLTNLMLKGDGFGADLLKTASVIELLVRLNVFFSEFNSHTDYRHTDTNVVIDTVIADINKSLYEFFSLERLAKDNFISKNHLCRMFKKHTGTTIVKYITIRRITEAKRLLKSSVPVKKVCEMVGFNDYSHFLRTFKGVVGVSPGKYVNTSNS